MPGEARRHLARTLLHKVALHPDLGQQSQQVWCSTRCQQQPVIAHEDAGQQDSNRHEQPYCSWHGLRPQTHRVSACGSMQLVRSMLSSPSRLLPRRLQCTMSRLLMLAWPADRCRKAIMMPDKYPISSHAMTH